VQAVIKGGTAYLGVSHVIDLDAERARLRKSLQDVEEEVATLEKKLSNKKFVDNAPLEIIEKNNARLEEENALKDKLNTALSRLV
jgi:valyl-tRNA synthetase